jgi:hypothetical protein
VDQKPPGIMFVYAALWLIWPHESAVPAADLGAAALTAWLLVVLGRRLAGTAVGFGAAALFLLLGDPSIQRLAGLNLRAQCETFIALAVVAAMVLVTSPKRRTWHLVLSGVSLALACWLKYNAAVYVLPIAVAALTPWPAAPASRRVAPLVAIGAGWLLVTTLALAHFWWHGAFADLRLATIDYNLQYSRETYAGAFGPVGYLATMPIARARVDLLWFLGLLGVLALMVRLRDERSAPVVLAWIAAACAAIVVNGARGLPQYFIQAAPALALAASAGAALAWRAKSVWRVAMILAIVVGVWRVGMEPTPVWRPRLGGLPSIATNAAFDGRRLAGLLEPREHLARFSRDESGGKFPLVTVSDLAARVRASTGADDRVLVFGFAGGGVLARAGRVSASRFFWSRPVVVEFARGVPGYGPAGLLDELRRRPPALVVLQKRDWGLGEPGVPHSLAYFMANDALRQWLEAGYALEDDGTDFAVWRRRP